jgi:hypothetical protein
MITNTYYSIYFILSLICGTYISCDGTWGKKHTNTYTLSQEFKDYTVFNTGSYWVYEDSASKAIDSIYLFSQTFSFVGGSYNRPDKSESLEQRKYSSLHLDTLFFIGYLPLDNQDGVYAELMTNILNLDINYFEATLGSYGVPSSNITFYDEKRDSIFFREKFYQVKIFTNLQQFINQSKKVYYANHIGLVRKELFNGQVWNLVRYHVSQ